VRASNQTWLHVVPGATKGRGHVELGHIVWNGPRSDLDAGMLTALYLGQSKVEGSK
jgi:hypothetical protein